MDVASSLQAHFEDLPDLRMEAKCDHLLVDIVMLAICATIAGADDWQEIELFGHSKEAWLRQWLDLPCGIPSHDTIERVFVNWIQGNLRDGSWHGQVKYSGKYRVKSLL